ncbi:MAG TPA: hypothetical protein VEI97_01970 [bacterium]|nr:hypothetical protein [bacterium]
MAAPGQHLPPLEPLGARFFARILQPGDLLLYTGTSLWSKLIMRKTWSPVSHAEIYLGEEGGKMVSYAARDGVGVNVFPTRLNDLTHVLRPKGELDMEALRGFVAATRGQAYDWWGLLRFFRIGSESRTKMFCFEACARAYKRAGLPLFHEAFDSDLASGNSFLASPAFEHWWVRRPAK